MLAEVEGYLSVIEALRKQVGEMIVGLDAEALNWRPLPGDDHATNSLAVLAAHVAGSEHFWIAEVIGRREATRVRAQEFLTQSDSAEALLRQLAAVGRETRELLEGLDEAALAEERTAQPLSGREGSKEARVVGVRWAILHVMEHSALHLGHMQLTRQLWEARG